MSFRRGIFKENYLDLCKPTRAITNSIRTYIKRKYPVYPEDVPPDEVTGSYTYSMYCTYCTYRRHELIIIM
jgi:hypothetical protein